MDETEKINYQVLEPLLNQILSGKPDKPVFENNKSDLCKDFLQTRSNYVTDVRLIENYIGKQTEIILNSFTGEDRISILQIIITNPIYINILIMQLKINNSDVKINDFQRIGDIIVGKIGDYILGEKIDYYIQRFFAIYFEELFYFEFAYDNQITEEEYLEIYSRNTNAKTLV
ncbi:hypothetical protein SY27_05220 [Flavobacterium sp. 316]|uniref:hypothetical protein n=1 Tax=Flavobacterium sp. 316 TaxID=1603293 RepID=UPI0005DCB54B|nr:hypothetical protein [Flavobacterium sp. 316]KIX22069.1 hypothetical protein SY27_05220 [Flavobacterium sp. 316]